MLCNLQIEHHIEKSNYFIQIFAFFLDISQPVTEASQLSASEVTQSEGTTLCGITVECIQLSAQPDYFVYIYR